MTYSRWTNPGEDDRKEEKTIEDAHDDDKQVHSEVVKLEKR